MKKTILFCMLAAVLLMTACADKKKKEHGDKAEYATMTVSRSDQTLVSSYTARLTGRQIVEVRPQVSGTITRICIKEGDEVKKGEQLFIIDQVPFQAALEVAQAAVETARAKLATAQMEYESTQTLKAEQVVSDYQLQTSLHALNEAKAALSLAKAQEVNARNNLSYTVVKSPVNGSASMIPYHVGALVSSSMAEPLVTVADDHEVYAYFSITEAQAMTLIEQYGSIQQFVQQAPGVQLQMAGGGVYSQQGRIDAVSGTVDAATGAVTLRAVFPNPQRLLRNGGSGTVLLPTHKKDCIVIPQTATYELQNKVFVYRVVDGKTVATPVVVFRLNNGKEYIVEQGLNEGDVIVSEGAGLLKEGTEIRSKKEEGRSKREK